MIEEAHKIDMANVLSKCQTLKDVDHHITARLFGFESADHYYGIVGCRQMIPNIKKPTLFIQSIDDPVCGYESIPTDDEIKRNPNVAMIKTSAGGHIGYFHNIFS